MTRQIHESETTIRAIIAKGRTTSIERDISMLRDQLADVRSARESVATAYYNLMQMDVPQMTETYEDNKEQQMDKAMDFEREVNELITRYDIQCAKLERRQSNETEGYNTHSEGCLLYTSPSPRDRG